ncbi:hypothetical protein ACFWPU_42710 [Streptomyces sp. NPDC058471]|uniref:hypothetical protein n=1 Tax=Streptomyces sp. NPDC058471 TaxID=3346516 RepID=UPI0036618230
MRSPLPAVSATAIGLILLSGCSDTSDTTNADAASQEAPPAPAGSEATSPAPRETAAELPAGMVELGDSLPDDGETGGSWEIETSPLKPWKTTPKAREVPDGWKTAVLTLTLTNTSSEIKPLPTPTVTARYGPEGREAAQFTDTGLTDLDYRLGEESDPKNIGPHKTANMRVGIAVPSKAAGQSVTLSIGDSFAEGPFPGQPAQPQIQTRPKASAKDLMKFDSWSSADRQPLRLAQPVVTPTQAGKVEVSLDVTFFNTEEAVNPVTRELGEAILRISYGDDLKETPDDPSIRLQNLAPSRAATKTITFKLPKAAVPGPLIIEVDSPFDGHVVTYEGEMSS